MYRLIRKPLLAPEGEATASPAVDFQAPPPAPETPVPASVANQVFELDDGDVGALDKDPTGESSAEDIAKIPNPLKDKLQYQRTEKVKPAPVKPTEVKTEVTPEVKTPEVDLEIEVPEAKPTPKTEEKLPPQRDYSEFPPELAEALKSTPNKVFKTVEKHVKDALRLQKEHAELAKFKDEVSKNGMPSNWYENPSAYQLHPEYQELSFLNDRAGWELDHWRNQLRNIKAGKEWNDISAFNPQTNKYVLKKGATADTDAEVYVMEKLQGLTSASQNIAGQLQGFEQTFQQRYQAANGVFDQVVDKFFAWSKDAKDERQESVKKFYGMVPIEFANQQGTKLAGLMYAQLAKSNKLVKELQQQIETGSFKAKEAEKIEPNIGSTPVDSGNQPVKIHRNGKHSFLKPATTFDLDGMDS
jgi:hypothetical protein